MRVFKLAQCLDGSGKFKKRMAVVKALRIESDFMYETKQGWCNGHQGQWLVELGEGIRTNMDDESFRRTYKPLEREGDHA